MKIFSISLDSLCKVKHFFGYLRNAMKILLDLIGAILLLSGASSAEELGESEFERYSALAEHPVCINLASEARLSSCGLFSHYQAASLHDYISRCGDILSAAELGTVPGFTAELAEALRYFVSFESHSAPGQRHSRRLRQSAMLRYSGGSGSAKYHARYGENAEAYISHRTATTASIAVYGRRPWKMVAGDFNARLAQGLLAWSGFSMSGVPTVASLKRNATGFSPTGSFSPAMRGFAAEWQSRRWSAGASASIDGRLLGFSTFSGRAFSLGINGCAEQSSSGISLNWRFGEGHLLCYGEAAWRNAPAAICGISWAPAYKTEAALLLRWYSPAFDSVGSGAVRSSTKVRDEAGVSAGFSRRWLGFTADLAVHPEKLQLRKSGYEQFKTVLNLTPVFAAGCWELRPSLRWTEKMQLNPSEGGFEDVWKHEVRGDLNASRRGLQGGIRLHAVQTEAKRAGGLAYVEVGYKTPSDTARLQLFGFVRGTICNTPDWASRIYTYERDLPGGFNVPAWYGRMQGVSLVAGIKYRRRRIRHQLNLRCALAQYARETGKAPRTELKLQYQIQL